MTDNLDNNFYEDETDDLITLVSANGEEIDFIEIAGIAYHGKFYVILQPVELMEGMEEDEALVFRMSQDENGNDRFEVELDQEIIDAVFEEYNRLLDNTASDEESGEE